MQQNNKIKNRVFSFYIILLSLMSISVTINANFLRDNTTQIVTDSITHLQWQDDKDAKTITKTWEEAINYCESLSLGGYTDWRLPNINELKRIIDRRGVTPAIVSGFQNTNNDYWHWYWSSTTYRIHRGYAWIVDFGSGFLNYGGKDNHFNFRCVRNEQ